jgi:hypothetical protein
VVRWVGKVEVRCGCGMWHSKEEEGDRREQVRKYCKRKHKQGNEDSER